MQLFPSQSQAKSNTLMKGTARRRQLQISNHEAVQNMLMRKKMVQKHDTEEEERADDAYLDIFTSHIFHHRREEV